MGILDDLVKDSLKTKPVEVWAHVLLQLDGNEIKVLKGFIGNPAFKKTKLPKKQVTRATTKMESEEEDLF